jgi:hypothetical protein
MKETKNSNAHVHTVLLNKAKKEKYSRNFRAAKFNRLLIIFQFRAVLIYGTDNAPS